MVEVKNRPRFKTVALTLRITPVEKIILAEMAQRQELNNSELIRQLIREESKRQGVWPLKSKIENINGKNG